MNSLRSPRVLTLVATATLAGVTLAARSPASAAPMTSRVTNELACTPRVGEPARPIDESKLATLGLLNARPLKVETPNGPDGVAPSISVLRIPGGVLLSLTASSNSTWTGSMLAAVNANGQVRWVQCFKESMLAAHVARVELGPVKAVVVVGGYSPKLTARAKVVSLVDGSIVDDVSRRVAKITGSDPGAVERVAATGQSVWFGAPPDADVGDDSRLARVDLSSLAVTEVAYPDAAIGMSASMVAFGETRAHDLYMEGDHQPLVSAVLRQGTWTSDPDAIAASYGEQVGFNEQGALTRWDPSGKELWSNPRVIHTGREGFYLGVDHGMVLVAMCTSGAQGSCPMALGGVDAATGKLVWQRKDQPTAVEFGDGRALATDPDGVAMIDVTTGRPISDRRWPGDAFLQACCGDESAHTTHNGGVVVAVNGTSVNIYYPADSGLGTAVTHL